MLSIQIDIKSLELVIYNLFNNIKLSFFASHMKSSFPLCTDIRYSRVWFGDFHQEVLLYSVSFASREEINIDTVYIFYLFLQPKLNTAKCRRNVENFLLACRKIGVREVSVKNVAT